MNKQEVAARTQADLSNFAVALDTANATPIMCVGIGHAGGPCPGRFVVLWPNPREGQSAMTTKEAFALIDAMRDELQALVGR